MSLAFATTRMRLALLGWDSGTADPNVGPVSGANGSYYQRQGNGTTTPTNQYLKTSSSRWARQNTKNLKVYNFRDYGGNDDGVTDNRLALQNLITTVDAAGGGEIYFPPPRVAGQGWAFTTRSTIPGAIFMIDVKHRNDLQFRGDGAASRILMAGNAGGGTYWFMSIHDGSAHITFRNFYVDGAGVINPAAGEQTHLFVVNSQTAGPDPFGGPRHVKFEDLYMGTVDGDGIRTLGAAGIAMSDVDVVRSSFVMPACRCCIAVQRVTRRLRVSNCYFEGSDDQNIDLEPTGAGDTEIRDVIFRGLQVHSRNISPCITLNGNGTQPNRRCLLEYTIFDDGGAVQMLDANTTMVHGVIVIMRSVPVGNELSAFYIREGSNDVRVSSSIADSPVTVGYMRLFRIENGDRTHNRSGISDSVGRCPGDSVSGQTIAISSTDGNYSHAIGNIVDLPTPVANVANGIAFETDSGGTGANIANGGTIQGNLVVGTNQALFMGFSFSAATWLYRNSSCRFNLASGANNGVRYISGSGGSFTGYHVANGNHAPDATGNGLLLSGIPGVTVDGNGGLAARYIQCPSAPAASMASVVGSVALFTGGVAGTVLNMKESVTAPAISDTTGWIGHGPIEIDFAAQSVDTVTAARFLAPSMALVIAGAAEIAIPMTRAGTIRAIRVKCIAGVGAANVTYTLRKNGVSQALTAVVSNIVTTGSGTGAIAVAAGDLISVQVTKSLAVATAQTFVVVTLDFSA